MIRCSMYGSGLLAAALLVGGSGARAEGEYGGEWTCVKQPVFHEAVNAALDEISAGNIGLRNVAFEYMRRWDVEEMRRQCAAFAAGEPYEISCLNGRRDWGAIKAMIPEDLFGLSPGAIRPHYLALQEEDAGQADAYAFCREVGAIPPQGRIEMRISQ